MQLTNFAALALLFASSSVATFRPRPEMALAVPRSGLPDAHARAASGSPYPYTYNTGFAKRQTSGSIGSAPAGSKVQVVQVSSLNGSLAFLPDDIQAEVGSFVQFQFHPKNHSVVQASFAAPCVPIQLSTPNTTSAFFSGFMPASAASAAIANSSLLTYTIKVTDTKPIWYYCSQGKHCQAGMVGAINAASNGTKTLAAFKRLAAVAVQNLSPGETPSVVSNATGSSSSSGSGSGSVANAGTTPAGSAASPAAAAQQTTNAGGRLGVTTGLAFVGVAVFALL